VAHKHIHKTTLVEPLRSRPCTYVYLNKSPHTFLFVDCEDYTGTKVKMVTETCFVMSCLVLLRVSVN